jgi:transcriptional regulator
VTRTPQDLLPGSLDLLILRSLRGESRHGYAVSRWVRERTEGVLEIEDAALYKALHRMEDKGWIEAEWGRSESKRRAKFYSLTREGESALERETRTWEAYSRAVRRVLGAS